MCEIKYFSNTKSTLSHKINIFLKRIDFSVFCSQFYYKFIIIFLKKEIYFIWMLNKMLSVKIIIYLITFFANLLHYNREVVYNFINFPEKHGVFWLNLHLKINTLVNINEVDCCLQLQLVFLSKQSMIFQSTIIDYCLLMNSDEIHWTRFHSSLNLCSSKVFYT